MLVVWLMVVALAGSLLTLVVPRRSAKTVAALVGAGVVALYIGLLMHPGQGVNVAWIPAWGVRFHLGSDGLSLFLLGLTVVLTEVAILASKHEWGPVYFFWILFLEFGSVGLFSALDLFLFYIFWEVVLIPVFFLLTSWSGPKGRRAGMKWLIMNLFGSLFMLIGIVAVAVIHTQPFGPLTFEISQLVHLHMDARVTPWVFAAFFLAFAIKAPLWPFHGWMPDAYREAPAPVTALVAGVMSKMGVYGFLRIMLPLFFPEFVRYETGLLILAVIGLVYGAFMALRQTDMKMVTAYASLSHIGMIALGIFSLTRVGILGATFQMVAHGLMVGGLFIVLGLLEQRAGSRELSTLRGLNASAPRFAAYFLFFALATLGLPGLPGFVGEYLIIQGLVVHHIVFAVIAIIVLVMAAWYMIRIFQGIMQGPEGTLEIADLKAGQIWWIVPLAGLVVLLGVWPNGITAHTVPSLYHAVHLLAGKGGGL